MKIVKGIQIEYVPANHEDPKDPGVLKKVLAVKDDLVSGRVQMVNWAKLPKGKSFANHYHEDMTEILIILSGRIKFIINNEETVVEKGDMVIVGQKESHQAQNIDGSDAEFISIGISQEKGGKTINL